MTRVHAGTRPRRLVCVSVLSIATLLFDTACEQSAPSATTSVPISTDPPRDTMSPSTAGAVPSNRAGSANQMEMARAAAPDTTPSHSAARDPGQMRAGEQAAPHPVDASQTATSDDDAGEPADAAASPNSPDAGRPVTSPPRLAPDPDQTPPKMLNGIAIDEDGYLWIADMEDSQLIRLEAPGEKIIARYGRELGVDGPDDLVLDKDFVYYTAALTLFGAVAKFDRKTEKVTTIAETGSGINPIAWGPNGKLLAGMSPAASGELGVALGLTGLFEIDPLKSGFKVLVEDDKGINAFCYAPDGYVYGPHGLGGTAVLRIDIESGEVTAIHEANIASAVRYNPRDQHLYVLAGESETRATLLRMALDGSDYSVFARMSDQPDATLTSADNFAIAPDGTFYVTRFQSPIITRISADGSRIEDFHVGKR